MMKNKKTLIIPVLILVMGIVATYKYLQNKSSQDSNILRVSGNIEVTDAQLSFKIPGRVEERLVSEGETVKVGQVVARLDDAELAQEVALRKVEVQVAQAALSELEAGSRPEEISQAGASVYRAQAQLNELLAGSRSQDVAASKATAQRVKADMDRLKAEYERRYELYKEGVISTNEYDTAQAAYKMAQAQFQEAEERLKLVKEGPRKEQIEQARAALMEAKERLAMIKKGPRLETIEQARARVEQTKQVLALAETRLGYATLISPL
ncbi:MAG: biotin/lipoyl-binding protein, partial [Nitrososphaera sp.]|nr:biotin/lipoyl-binding protein [Nitrososphaera sp.]